MDNLTLGDKGARFCCEARLVPEASDGGGGGARISREGGDVRGEAWSTAMPGCAEPVWIGRDGR